MNQRIKWIDVAKGICILSVILGHCGNAGNTLVNRIVFAYHLTVFFILSGYSLKKKNMDSNYFAKKFNRLIKPYFITCLIILLMDIFEFILIYKIFNFRIIKLILKQDIIRTLFASGTISQLGPFNTGKIIGAIWFLPAMFFAIIIAQFIINKTDNWFYRFLSAFILATIAVITAKYIWLPFSIQSSLFALPFIILGVFIKEFKILDKFNILYFLICVFIYFLGVITDKSIILFVTSSMPDIIFTPIIAIASSFVVIKISMILENSKFLAWVGRNSLLILCVHLIEIDKLPIYKNIILTRLKIPVNTFSTFIVFTTLCLLIVLLKDLYKKKKIAIP